MPRTQFCEGCFKTVPTWCFVHLSGEGEDRYLCDRCHNEYVAERMGLDHFEHPDLDPFDVPDFAGKTRTFHFLVRLVGAGLCIDAFEVDKKGFRTGYQFAVFGNVHDNPFHLVADLRQKITNALATRNLDRHEGEPALPCGRPVLGRIESSEEEREPVLWIDGKPLSWEKFAELLLTYEGWQFRLEIRDRTEGW